MARTPVMARATAGADVTRAPTPRATPPASDIAPVAIERLILHHLDGARHERSLVDAEAELDDAARAFFAGYVLAAARRAEWRATFCDDRSAVPLLCQGLLAGSQEFVAASQHLARRLYAAMCRRPRQIAPGDFVAIVYHHMGRRQIALLKLEPDRRLTREFTCTGGHLRVRIATTGNLLPDAQGLQKCALLRAVADRAVADRAVADRAGSFEVTLLDTQAGPRSEGVAAFFYREFLTATLAPSARRQTRRFISYSETWLDRHADCFTPAQTLQFYHARRAALAGDQVDLITFAASALPDHAALRADVVGYLAAALADGTAPTAEAVGRTAAATAFAVDRATAGPLVRTVTLRLDGAARLGVSAAEFARLVRVDPRRHGGNIRLVIESLTLREGGAS